MGKTALVLGATGVVGRELVEQLSQSADIDKVVAITRRPIDYDSDKISNCVVEFDRLEEYSSVFNADIIFSASLGAAPRVGVCTPGSWANAVR